MQGNFDKFSSKKGTPEIEINEDQDEGFSFEEDLPEEKQANLKLDLDGLQNEETNNIHKFVRDARRKGTKKALDSQFKIN